MTDARGVPLSAVVDGANRHDMKLLEATLDAVVCGRPEPTAQSPQGLCLDKGFDYAEVRELAESRGYEPHIRSRGEEAHDLEQHPGAKARRWVVERVHSWYNRWRGLLVRWAKKPVNHLGDLQLASALIAFQQAGVFG